MDQLASLLHQNFDFLLRFASCRVCFANIELLRMTDRRVVLAKMVAALCGKKGIVPWVVGDVDPYNFER